VEPVVVRLGGRGHREGEGMGDSRRPLKRRETEGMPFGTRVGQHLEAIHHELPD